MVVEVQKISWHSGITKVGVAVAEKISDTETSTGVIELGGDAGDSGGGTATTTTGVINISDGEDMEVSVGDANAANMSMPLWQVGGPAWWFGSRHVSIKGSDLFAATCLWSSATLS